VRPNEPENCAAIRRGETGWTLISRVFRSKSGSLADATFNINPRAGVANTARGRARMEDVGPGCSDSRRGSALQRLGANVGALGTFANSDPADAACA